MTGLQGRDWRQLAACARPGVDPEWFFPNSQDGAKIRRAKRICADCAVKAPCLADALSRSPNSDFGIYGGTTPQQRVHLRQWAEHDRLRPSLIIDPGLAAEAFELARRIGTTRAAQQLGIDAGYLYRVWDRWHLGRPNYRGGAAGQHADPVLDPLIAQRTFLFAEQVGLAEAAERLGIDPDRLEEAWKRWGLGRAGAKATPARRAPEARSGDQRTRPPRVDQTPRRDVDLVAQRQTSRARAQQDREREQ